MIPLDTTTSPPPTSRQLFLVFARIGLTSFGGGLSGWMLREIVQDRAWISEEEFLNGLALSQALPGVNVTNMAIWIGYHLRGTMGAVASVTGIVVPPAITLILIATGFTALARFALTASLLAGASAAAVGLSLSMGLATARRVPRRLVPILFVALTFVAVGVLHWPLPWVVLGFGSASVAIEYARLA